MTVQTQEAFPTLDEWRDSFATAGEFAEQLDRLVTRLERAVSGEAVPALAEVGALYVALDNLDIERQAIEELARRMRRMLDNLPQRIDERGGDDG